jgi:hypothetical protein
MLDKGIVTMLENYFFYRLNLRRFYPQALLSFYILISSSFTYAATPNGFFKCNGYYEGNSTRYNKINFTASLEIQDNNVIINSSYEFYKTNIKNPFGNVIYKNCGIEYSPKLSFQLDVCGNYDKNGKMIVVDNGILNMVTLEASISHIKDDASATLKCEKSDFVK